MKETSHFSIYHHLAGVFTPFWLLSRRELSAGAKLTYCTLALQANAKSQAQLNFPLLCATLGENEGQVARHLSELEERGLIESLRGNANSEDVRLFFPPHQWMNSANLAPENLSSSPATNIPQVQSELFPPAAKSDQDSQQPARQHSYPSERRQRKRKRWSGPPLSKHPLETIRGFINYQKYVLGHKNIWNPEGLALALFHSGEQDDEITEWKSQMASGEHAA